MIKENLKEVLASLKPGVELVAVSKYHPIEAVKEAYEAGQRVFGESREQELRVKYEAFENPVRYITSLVEKCSALASRRAAFCSLR